MYTIPISCFGVNRVTGWGKTNIFGTICDSFDRFLYIVKDWTSGNMGRSACATAMVVCATILGPIVMVLLAVSFATDHWLYFNVNTNDIEEPLRSQRTTILVTGRYATERHRGMWRECYPTNDTECKYTCNVDYIVLRPCCTSCHAYFCHRNLPVQVCK